MRVVACGRGMRIVRNPVPKMPVELVCLVGKGKSEVQSLMLKVDTPKKYVSFK
jgi:hypothetical protein